MTPKKESNSSSGAERRRTRRRPVLDTFSLFAVVPRKGAHRLPLHDLSDSGVGFSLDMEGEEHGDFPVKAGDELEIHIYLNQSLYLPLSAKVARIVKDGGTRRIGAEFTGRSSKAHQAFLSFLQTLDILADAAQIDAP